MLENSYVLLGFSSFNAPHINQNQAIEQAKKVHAETVIVYSKYTHTLSGVTPVSSPTSETTHHSGLLTTDGSIGSTPFSGSTMFTGTSTTHGTQTTYVPYNIQRYDYFSTYWIKIKTRLGIYAIDLTQEIRDKIESNKGVCVGAVVKGSPAFTADVLKGDIIKKFNDVEIIDGKHFSDLFGAYNESIVRLEILREAKIIIKDIILSDSSKG